MLLLDRLMQGPIDNYMNSELEPKGKALLLDGLQSAQAFEISNVADYYARSKSVNDEWRMADFPNIAPPFSCYWMEFAYPRAGLWELLADASTPKTLGVLTWAMDLANDPLKSVEIADRHFDERQVAGYEAENETARSYGVADGLRFYLIQHAFMGDGRRAFGPWIVHETFIKEDGSNFLNTCSPGRSRFYPWVSERLSANMPSIDDLQLSFIALMYPVWLATSLLHCKNVTTRSVSPPPKLAKRQTERHGRPAVTYHVLTIDPMRKVLESEGESGSGGLQRALHICRGHFKDYRESGLFGRNHGMYWWGSQVRGSIEAGIATKDYRVLAGKM